MFHLVYASSPFHVEGNVPSSGVKQNHVHWQHGKERLLLSGTPCRGEGAGRRCFCQLSHALALQVTSTPPLPCEGPPPQRLLTPSQVTSQPSATIQKLNTKLKLLPSPEPKASPLPHTSLPSGSHTAVPPLLSPLAGGAVSLPPHYRPHTVPTEPPPHIPPHTSRYATLTPHPHPHSPSYSQHWRPSFLLQPHQLPSSNNRKLRASETGPKC